MSAYGSRKFIAFVLVLIAASLMGLTAKIDSDTYGSIVEAAIWAYMVGNVAKYGVTAYAGKTETPK